MKLIFATNNKNKLREISQILDKKYEILSLEDIGFKDDIEETESTIKGNSELKADFIYEKYKINCFADDTGLEIDYLNGEPGVFSARYAGESHNDNANIAKVLKKLDGIKNRKAQFVTVITLIIDGKKYFLEGIAKGEIIEQKHGKNGFGYDPIFRPEGYLETFAEIPVSVKNKISHRGIATKKLIELLNSF